jgi:hypothetical protein
MAKVSKKVPKDNTPIIEVRNQLIETLKSIKHAKVALAALERLESEKLWEDLREAIAAIKRPERPLDKGTLEEELATILSDFENNKTLEAFCTTNPSQPISGSFNKDWHFVYNPFKANISFQKRINNKNIHVITYPSTAALELLNREELDSARRCLMIDILSPKASITRNINQQIDIPYSKIHKIDFDQETAKNHITLVLNNGSKIHLEHELGTARYQAWFNDEHEQGISPIELESLDIGFDTNNKEAFGNSDVAVTHPETSAPGERIIKYLFQPTKN